MLSGIKAVLKAVTPPVLLEWYRRRQRARLRQSFATLSTRDAFSKIYDENLWGGSPGEICSGSGSTPEYAQAYANAIRGFLLENKIGTVVDLGCGDFAIGNMIQIPKMKYIGVDVVPRVIERNLRLFKQENIEFKCLDIIDDELPTADVCLIRQVLQHLSNAQIEKVLCKTKGFKWLIITEHLPAESARRSYNSDKPHGPDTRLTDSSGVFLEMPPFNLAAQKTLLDHKITAPLMADGERLLTLVFCRDHH